MKVLKEKQHHRMKVTKKSKQIQLKQAHRIKTHNQFYQDNRTKFPNSIQAKATG